MKKSEIIEKSDGVYEIFAYDDETPEKKHLVYKINKNKKQIIFIPDEEFTVNKVTLEGFENLPPEFSKAGYIKGGLMYYLPKKLGENKITDFIISKTDKSRIRKIKSGNKLVLNYLDFSYLKAQLTSISNEAKQERSITVDKFFYQTYPRRYKKKFLSKKSMAKKAIRNLSPEIIEDISSEDVSHILDFIETLLKSKYKSEIHKRKLFSTAKIRIDDIAISEIIKKFDQMLKEDPSENKWGSFLKRNLYLIDSKYVHALPELNVVLANTRKADFGLIDSHGYLDIFEIKKPTTKILSSRTDRGNYYWSKEATMAIVQAEKYLYHAERKAPSLTEDIDVQRNKKVQVIKPRAFVILGSTKELDERNKQQDFRILRMSLKNIEIVLYDELLKRIKNQKGKIYID